jgi:integrase
VDKKSPATIKGYLSYKKNRLQRVMDSNVYDMTNDQWQAAVDRDFKKLSDKYAKNVWSFVASAVEEETGERPKIDLEAPQRNARPWLDPDEIKIFVEAVKGTSVEIAALLELSSLRVSEVMDVKGTDVDLKNNRIRIQGSAVYGPDGFVHKEKNKTRKSTRYIPILPPVREALESIPLTDDYLVKMKPNGVYRAINKICAANGLPEVGNHGLRHSFASLCYHLHIEEKIAMEIGGWEDSKTMHDIYTHLAEKDIAARSELLSNFFVANPLQK